MGGCEVMTEADARTFTAELQPPRVVEVGELLDEEPCVNLDVYRGVFPGRECPRVELDPENVDAATLVQMRLAEDPLTPAFFDAACGDLPREERKKVLLRVLRAAGDDTVQRLTQAARQKTAEG
jgi:hypothetical protein